MRMNDQETSGRMRNKTKNLRRYWGLLLACALAGSAMPIGYALAQEQSVAPGINQRFLEGQNFGEFIDQFEREGREIFDNRHAILKEVGLKPGMTVADIGAGSGLFTQLFAREVGPKGKVYAVEINPIMVNNIVRRSREEGYQHVEGSVSTAKTMPLPPASLDVAFTSDVYHHFEFPQIMLRAIRTALKPGATFIVVDFERIPGVSSERILSHVRAGKETVIKEVEAEGFRMVEERKIMQQNYFVRFVKN
jgi:ubiquinone/menaquinone biosynthesis C-methylase UbiE